MRQGPNGFAACVFVKEGLKDVFVKEGLKDKVLREGFKGKFRGRKIKYFRTFFL
jgi:hypothetical protein